MVTLKDLKAGTELSCHYMIDMEEAAADSTHKWYVDLWDEFSKGQLKTKGEDLDELMDIADDQDFNEHDANYSTAHHLNY